jgi:cytochrome c-type biogenesis protein CcmH/NrfF
MRLHHLHFFLSGLMALACLVSSLSPAQDQKAPFDEKRYKEVASELRCPSCQGLSVLESDASFSVQIREEVKKQLAAGKDKKQILTFFTDRYGPWILRRPTHHGIGLIAWIFPVALLLGGIGFAAFLMTRRRRKAPSLPHERSRDMILAEMDDWLSRLRTSQKGGE